MQVSIGRGCYPLKGLDQFIAIEAAELIQAEACDCVRGEAFRGSGNPLAIGARHPLFGDGVVHLPTIAMQSSLKFKVYHCAPAICFFLGG
jgi:hypothetical protein